MLSRARYEDESQIDKGEDVGTKFYSILHCKNNYVCISFALEFFKKELCEGDWILIGSYLSTLTKQES